MKLPLTSLCLNGEQSEKASWKEGSIPAISERSLRSLVSEMGRQQRLFLVKVKQR